jgi:hypothetical protein
MSEPKKNTWLKYLVGAIAGFIGLEVANNVVCTHLSESRWEDFGSFVSGINYCANGSSSYFVIAFLAGLVLCGYFTEQRRRPIVGSCIGLSAGALAGALTAFIYFIHLFGWR